MDSENTLSPEILDDPNHWMVYLRGQVGGVETYRNYHLAAGSKGEAGRTALLKWGGEFDTIPFVDRAERYRTWRAYEPEAEGPPGVSRSGVSI